MYFWGSYKHSWGTCFLGSDGVLNSILYEIPPGHWCMPCFCGDQLKDTIWEKKIQPRTLIKKCVRALHEGWKRMDKMRTCSKGSVLYQELVTPRLLTHRPSHGRGNASLLLASNGGERGLQADVALPSFRATDTKVKSHILSDKQNDFLSPNEKLADGTWTDWQWCQDELNRGLLSPGNWSFFTLRYFTEKVLLSTFSGMFLGFHSSLWRTAAFIKWGISSL